MAKTHRQNNGVSKMLVKLNNTGPVTISKPKSVEGGCFVLVPGSVNEIDDASWEIIKDNPQIKGWIADGTWKVLTDYTPIEKKTTGKGGVEKAIALSAMSADEAKEVVAETLNKPLLEAWSEAESRRPVLRQIERQLEVLKPKVKEAS